MAKDTGPSKAQLQNANIASNDKQRSLDEAVSRMEKTFGKGSIMRLGERTHMVVDTTPTGSLSLDLALGGGLPRGRLIEIFGAEGGGKTTLALHVVAEAQKAGGICAYIDAEHALDPEYARSLGVDIDNLYISQPDNGEQALEIADTLVRSGAIDCIIVDSVAALTPRAEIEGEMGELQVGAMARLMSHGCRKLASSVGRANAVVLFINQIREKVGVMYGSPETTPGGRALKFFASVRMRVSRGEAIKNGSEQIGSRTKVSILKNKIAPPFRDAEFDLIFGKGISKYGDILDLAVQKGLIQKGGAWFTVGEERFQGRDNVRAYLEEHPEYADELEDQIREAFGLRPSHGGAPAELNGLNGTAAANGNGVSSNGTAPKLSKVAVDDAE
ncbi:MAG: recombinase RecA [Abitibacteriaceae bacterium]|nr:recombinase RecA [Abditibacteriaceae bacterium]MBV9868116.1 recombinase RecA [Abditibacteriaceae bacterium]